MKIFCEDCGAEMGEDAIFCPDCGQRLPRDFDVLKHVFTIVCSLAAAGILVNLAHNLGLKVVASGTVVSKIAGSTDGTPAGNMYQNLISSAPGYAFALVMLPVAISSIAAGLLAAWLSLQLGVRKKLGSTFCVSCICVIAAIVHLAQHAFPPWSYCAVLLSGFFIIVLAMHSGRWVVGSSGSQGSLLDNPE